EGAGATAVSIANDRMPPDGNALGWDEQGIMYVSHFGGGITRCDGKVAEPMRFSSGSWPTRIVNTRRYGPNEFWLCGLNGLWLYDGAKLTAYTNGLPGQRAFDIFKEKDGSYLVGTGGGLARFDGQRFGAVYIA